VQSGVINIFRFAQKDKSIDELDQFFFINASDVIA